MVQCVLSEEDILSGSLEKKDRIYMRVLHVTMGLSPQSGGPTRSVKGLCRSLSMHGIDVTLLVISGHHEFERPCGVRIVYGVPNNVKEMIKEFDLVHLHGLWNLDLHRVSMSCREKRIRYLVSPRGMLDPWALSVKKWKKKVAMWLYQREDLKGADAFHATADKEARHIRLCGFKQPIIVAPNGVEVPVQMPKKMPIDDYQGKTAIFLSRLHPGKGLITLAEAWARIRPYGWRMLVVGPDSYGHKAEVVSKLDQLGILADWKFIDYVNDDWKWRYYRSADLLVHPSVSENFGITIAEGLAAGLPVIATKGTPWRELEERKCGWWIDIGIEPLADALREAISLEDAARSEMGVRGRALVEEKYTWPAVVEVMKRGYESV